MTWREQVHGVLCTVAVVLAVAASLLVFPSGLLWMAAFWLSWFTLVRVRGRSGWLPLVACIAVLLVKRPDWSPGLFTLTSVMAVVVLIPTLLRNASRRTNHIALWVGVVLLWACWGIALWESSVATCSSQRLTLDEVRPIVCLGDSLTTGMTDQESYPRYLQRLVTIPVINMGQAGITAEDALTRLNDVIEANPQVVVVELGGHDYLRGYGRQATRDCLVRIIDACHDIGAAVVLVEIPRGFIVDSFSGLERELAQKYDLDLVPDTAIRMLVLRSPALAVGEMFGGHLSDDGLHPNVAGAQFLAKKIAMVLERMYGPAVVREND